MSCVRLKADLSKHRSVAAGAAAEGKQAFFSLFLRVSIYEWDF